MTTSPDHKLLDRVFDISIIIKGINGALELLGGLALFFVDVDYLRGVLRWVSAHAVVAHDHSPMGHWLDHLAATLGADSTAFAAWYLILHGVIKVVLVWALLKEKMWAYPWMVAALVAFTLYQFYELFVHFTWFMLALTVFDLFIIGLTLREWQLHKQRRAAQQAKTGRLEPALAE